MARAVDSNLEEQVARLRRLAAEWREKSAETTDEYYIALMTRTAEALEAQAADLLGQVRTPACRASLRNG